MPRLIVLNGPPACGKSTLATRYVDEHPLALNLDIDRIRGLLGRWREDAHGAGLLARAIAVAAARTHLAAGHDVVVPQLLARVEFLERLELVARETGASFHEVVLMDTRENVVRRFAARTAAAADPAHVEAHEMLERSGGPAQLSTMYDQLVATLAARPGARVVPTTAGRVDEAYRAMLAALDGPAD